MLWDCPSCGAKTIAGETCPTCGSPRPSISGTTEPRSTAGASAAPGSAPKQPWTIGRIIYNVFALIGGLVLLPVSGRSRWRMDTPDLEEGTVSTTLYAIVGGVVVVGVIILGMVYFSSQNRVALQVNSTKTAVLSARPVIMAEMKKHLAAWQEMHDTAVHRVDATELALPPDIHLVEVDYGYCDSGQFYAYAVTTMVGDFQSGAYGTVLAFTTGTWTDPCGPKKWMTIPVTQLEDGWFEGQFAYFVNTPTSPATKEPTRGSQ